MQRQRQSPAGGARAAPHAGDDRRIRLGRGMRAHTHAHGNPATAGQHTRRHRDDLTRGQMMPPHNSSPPTPAAAPWALARSYALLSRATAMSSAPDIPPHHTGASCGATRCCTNASGRPVRWSTWRPPDACPARITSPAALASWLACRTGARVLCNNRHTSRNRGWRSGAARNSSTMPRGTTHGLVVCREALAPWARPPLVASVRLYAQWRSTAHGTYGRA